MSNPTPDKDLDLTFLYDIADGSNEFIVESIDMFTQHVPEGLDVIENAISVGDWIAVSASAHKIKANLGFFGMPVSESIMKEIELLAKADEPDAALLAIKFKEVYTIISASLVTLNELKAGLL